MTQYQITIPLKARPQGSKRHVGGGRMIEQAGEGLKQYRAAMRAEAKRKCHTSLTGPVGVYVSFTISRPKRHYHKNGSLLPTAPMHPVQCVRGDIDKLTRSTLDALTGVAYHDDKQVVGLIANVLWGVTDQTSVLVTDLTNSWDGSTDDSD